MLSVAFTSYIASIPPYMATVLILIQNKHSNIIYIPNIIRRLMLCHAFPVYTFSPCINTSYKSTYSTHYLT